jgi:hypothetical protein
MENISGKNQASLGWTLWCATMGLAINVSLCFAQGNQGASIEMQRVQEMQRAITAPPAIMTPRREFLCDSRVPEVCLDIYQRRMGTPEPILYGEPSAGGGIRSGTIPAAHELCRGTRLRESAC